MSSRQEEIRAKGFDMVHGSADYFQSDASSTGYQGIGMPNPPSAFNKIKIGLKSLDDAVMKLGTLKKISPNLASRENILKSIFDYDLKTMREESEFFYRGSGIYARIIRYMAFLYRYDWFVTPYVNDEKIKPEKLLDGFHKCLAELDNFAVKKTLGEISLKVLIYGAYYGYKVETKNGVVLQELPVNYCRSRFYYGRKPAVEFNMRYFDEQFRNTEIRMRVLKMFPKEFAKGYELYKLGKLPQEPGTTQGGGWYLLDPKNTVKFNANGDDYPPFISVIPLLIDLDEARDLDKKKTLQRLLKIVVQKMPLDKNGDLIFDIEEAQQLHNNAVQMLGRAIGVDVLTTFADIEVEDMDASKSQSQTDDLQRIERQIYNDAGVSQNQFNTDGNIALEKSILNDEATLYNLILQYEQFLNELLEPYNTSKKKVEYRVQILTTTIYNYKEMSKMYKEEMQLGFSKMLPQIALGQSQSSILANAYFENDILNLIEVFIPPLMSSTMNKDVLDNSQAAKDKNKANDKEAKKALDPQEKKGPGREELADDQKSEKTIRNRESMS